MIKTFLIFTCILFNTLTLKAEEQYLIIDFSAKWCGACQTMKKDVWQDKEVLKYIEDSNNILFKEVDTTLYTKEANKWKVSSLPTIIIAKWNMKDKLWKEHKRAGFMDKSKTLDWLRKTVHRIEKRPGKINPTSNFL